MKYIRENYTKLMLHSLQEFLRWTFLYNYLSCENFQMLHKVNA